ncbi:hypothetical protein [Mycobacterium haemophilum]
MLDTATATAPYVADKPVFVVAVTGIHTPFSIDDAEFARWVVTEGDELARNLPDPGDEDPGLTLSDLIYQAQSAGVLVGDPAIELNIHSAVAADDPGYFVRLNNFSGCQRIVGLTRGWHELHWPPNALTPSGRARYHLQEICDVANALLYDLPAAPDVEPSRPNKLHIASACLTRRT